MNKRTIYTVFGVALSLLIATGGWFITNSLLDRKESDLLSARGSVHVDAPQQTNTVPPDDSVITSDPTKLTAAEMYTVLEYWELNGTEQAHEPTDGQISMEQALNRAHEWLEYFCGQGLLSSKLLDYEPRKTNAYLSRNVPSQSGATAQNPLVKAEDIRDSKLLEPFYSYWTVRLYAERLNIMLIINAGTGQIWKAEIDSSTATINFNGVNAEEMQTAFKAYIDIENADGILNTNAEISPGTLENQTVLARVVLSVSAIIP